MFPIKKCPKAKVKTGRKARKPVPHGVHDWVAGVYLPVGDCDGYWARCPGYYLGVPVIWVDG